MENTGNKHFLIQKTSVAFQQETEMLRGGLNTLYDILVIRRGPGRPTEVDLENAILDALNEFPFHSLRSLSRVLKRDL
jgi:hypothetical protein